MKTRVSLKYFVSYCRFQNLAATNNFDFFGKNFSHKRILPVKNKKNEHHHWILCTRTSLSTEFQPKLTILTFWIKFVWKWCFRSKTKKVNITTELSIFELILEPNFSLNWQFWFFGSNLPKKGISGQKQIKSVSPMNCAYLN